MPYAIDTTHLKFYLFLQQVFDDHAKVIGMRETCTKYCQSIEEDHKHLPLFRSEPKSGIVMSDSYKDVLQSEEEKEMETPLYGQKVHAEVKTVYTLWNLVTLFDNSCVAIDERLMHLTDKKSPNVTDFENMIAQLQESFAQIATEKILLPQHKGQMKSPSIWRRMKSFCCKSDPKVQIYSLFKRIHTQFNNTNHPHPTFDEQDERVVKTYLIELDEKILPSLLQPFLESSVSKRSWYDSDNDNKSSSPQSITDGNTPWSDIALHTPPENKLPSLSQQTTTVEVHQDPSNDQTNDRSVTCTTSLSGSRSSSQHSLNSNEEKETSL